MPANAWLSKSKRETKNKFGTRVQNLAMPSTATNEPLFCKKNNKRYETDRINHTTTCADYNRWRI